MPEIPDPTWTISETPEAPGEEIALEGWHASKGAGGCLRAGGRVDAETARRVRQGWELKAYVGGRCVWSGPISRPPLVYRGTAELAAEGWRSKADKTSGRLLYQTRDVSLLVPEDVPPHGYGTTIDHVDVTVEPNSLLWRMHEGSALNTGDNRGVLLWAKGTPGGITRYAFTVRDNIAGGGDNVITTYRATGPNGGATAIADHTPIGGVIGADNTISNPQDLLIFEFRRAGVNTTLGFEYYVQIYNLRVNGIASGDTFTISQVVSDILGRLGFDISGVQSSGVNALPYDQKEGSWFSGLEYMAFLADWPVVNIVPADDGTRMGIYRPWGEKVHTISLENAEPELNSLPLYNGVTVSYPSVGGFQAEVTIRPSDIGESDPLAGTDSDNILAINLSDAQPQPDAALATAQGQAVLARLLNPREEGTMVVPAVPDATLWDLRHGDHLNVSDWAPLEAHELPIDSVELRQGQPARISIYSPGSELGLAARFGLEQARLIQNPELPVIDIIEVVKAEEEAKRKGHSHAHGPGHHLTGKKWHPVTTHTHWHRDKDRTGPYESELKGKGTGPYQPRRK